MDPLRIKLCQTHHMHQGAESVANQQQHQTFHKIQQFQTIPFHLCHMPHLREDRINLPEHWIASSPHAVVVPHASLLPQAPTTIGTFWPKEKMLKKEILVCKVEYHNYEGRICMNIFIVVSCVCHGSFPSFLAPVILACGMSQLQ